MTESDATTGIDAMTGSDAMTEAARPVADGEEPDMEHAAATRGASLHVVSAWIRPGRTRFTVDGPLPSDGDGRGLAIVALLVIVAGGVVSSRARWRVRVLRRVAIALRRVRGWTRRIVIVRVGVPVVVLVLLVKGCATSHRPADAFLVGTGVRGTATVEARLVDGAWVECDYVRVRGEYDCDGLATVTDVTANLVSDAPPSWPFISPAVQASAYGPHVEVRIRRSMRLAGRYWAGSSHPATLAIGGREHVLAARTTETLDLDDGERDVVWQAELPFPQALDMTLVKTDAIDPPRPYLVAPPEQPPSELLR